MSISKTRVQHGASHNQRVQESNNDSTDGMTRLGTRRQVTTVQQEGKGEGGATYPLPSELTFPRKMQSRNEQDHEHEHMST